MYRRIIPVFALSCVLVLGACTNKHVQNPLADVGSAQPDKILFDRALDAMKHNKFDVARITLQTLINTYPDSEYIARAKLAVGDSWYAAGGSAAFAQAEAEYKDFITFFPNMPEAAEAQLKIANIHYRQMQKPDRDFTHAKRAEDEYRRILLQFPDSKLVADAKQRLLEVQEVLAEREFRIGRFYFLRESWAAAIARLQSVSDAYPLYSSADEALFMLGQAYERQVENIRGANVAEVAKGRLIKNYSDQAAKAYSQILVRYPVMARAIDAKTRLEAMSYPVPKPTPEAIAQNEREQASRSEPGMVGKLWSNFSRNPDTSSAAKNGEPTLVDPKPTNATEVVRAATKLATEGSGEGKPEAGNNAVSVETVKTGSAPENQPLPRSQPAPAASTNSKDTGIPELIPLSETEATPPGATAATAEVPPAEAPAPAPEQVNEVTGTQDSPEAKTAEDRPAQESSSPQSSSSRPKKKRGFLGVF